jgi:hypothetical protein
LVGRLRNRGQVKALDVKVNFFMCDPPGAGDRGKNFKLIGSVTEPEIPGGDNPKNVLLRWDVPSGSSGHSCLVVEVEDYRIPEDSTGAALGSDDVWRVNNHCQKNVDKYEALSASPFAPIDFDFSVHNDGVDVETAYLEPDGLPDGMRLTVTPPRRSISAGATVMFHCKLELDEEVIRTGCENDQRFRIVAWRQEGESAVRWGGVEYEVRPREKTETTIMGGWGYGNDVEVNGAVTPDPGGGTVRLRLDFQNQQPEWLSLQVAPGGAFGWTGYSPPHSFTLGAVAWFDGNRSFGSSRSNDLHLTPPPPVR